MPSPIARKIAGTYVEDEVRHGTILWVQEQCRSGALKDYVKAFAEAQEELLDPSMVVVDIIGTEIHCRIPAMLADHESKKTFRLDVGFTLDPTSGLTSRVQA